jgi:phosphatidylglycerophosphate synthase
MVESLKELNKICQKPRYKEAGNWMVRNILREAALPLTWLLLHTPVTANQVTLTSLIVGVLGGLLFGLDGRVSFLGGSLLLELWYYLDHVDGQIARYRKTASLTGRFFDFVTHHVIHGVTLFALGWHVFAVTGAPFFVLWGFAASFAITLFNVAQDAKCKTFYERLAAMDHIEVLRKSDDVAAPEEPARVEGFGAFRRAFSFVHKACEIHVLMNVLTGAAILEMFVWRSVDFRSLLFLGYGMMCPVLAVTKVSHWILARRIDGEFDGTFRAAPK